MNKLTKILIGLGLINLMVVLFYMPVPQNKWWYSMTTVCLALNGFAAGLAGFGFLINAWSEE